MNRNSTNKESPPHDGGKISLSKLFAIFPVFPIFAATSLLVGLSIPAFYDWTGADQSRASPIVNQTAIGLLLVGIVICIALPWLPFEKDPSTGDGGSKFQFKLRTILIITAVIAAILAIFPKASLLVLGNGMFVLALANAWRFWMAFRHIRWRIVSLVACMYFPFAWLVSFDNPAQRSFEFLWMINGLPAMIPTLLVGGLVNQHTAGLAGLSSMLAGVELTVGLWVIRCGPRWAIAYHLFAIILSIYGSFALNALIRM